MNHITKSTSKPSPCWWFGGEDGEWSGWGCADPHPSAPSARFFLSFSPCGMLQSRNTPHSRGTLKPSVSALLVSTPKIQVSCRVMEPELCPRACRGAGGCAGFPAPWQDAVLWDQGLAHPAWKRDGGARRTAPAKSSKQTTLTGSPAAAGLPPAPGERHWQPAASGLGATSAPCPRGGQMWREAGGGFGEGSFLLVGKRGVPSRTGVAAGAEPRRVLSPLWGGGTSKPAAQLVFLT